MSEKVSKEQLSDCVRVVLENDPGATYREVREKLEMKNIFVSQARLYYYYNKIRNMHLVAPNINDQIYIKKEIEMDLSNSNQCYAQGTRNRFIPIYRNINGMQRVQAANDLVPSSVGLDAQNISVNDNGMSQIQAVNNATSFNVGLNGQNINDNGMIPIQRVDVITSNNIGFEEQNINNNGTLSIQTANKRDSINIKFYSESEYNIKKRLLEKKELELIKQEEVAKRKLELVDKELQIAKRQVNLKKILLEIQSKLEELQKIA